MDDQAMAVNRVFVAVATDKDIEPGAPGFSGQWVVHKDNKAALEPVEHLLRIPNNAILVSNIQEGMALMNLVKEKLMPNLSKKSGLQICVVHTEAVLSPDPSQNNLQATVLLFPVGYLSMEALEMDQKMHQQSLEVSVNTEGQAEENTSPLGDTEKTATFTVIEGGKYDPQLVDFSDQHPLIRYITASEEARRGNLTAKGMQGLQTAWSDLRDVVTSMVAGDYPPTMTKTMPAYLMSVSMYLVGHSKWSHESTMRLALEWLDYVMNDTQISWCDPVERPIVSLTACIMRDEPSNPIDLYPSMCVDVRKFSRWTDTQSERTKLLSYALLSVLDVWQAEAAKKEIKLIKLKRE